MDLLRETQATAKEANKTFESLFQRRHYVDSAFQILIGIVSFALIILILVGPKTDEFGWPGLAEIIFTIWIFFANIVFALVYAFISTQRRKKDLEAAEKTAQKVANDWFISAHRTEYAHLWQQIAEQQKNKSSIVT
ncbi:hypothetical protein BX666DRAFT_1910145 [Dichotomocladium elegans]|nr:hypothetical protein BX666DRAFT_1910145 [Dichotomocladium elegans]